MRTVRLILSIPFVTLGVALLLLGMWITDKRDRDEIASRAMISTLGKMAKDAGGEDEEPN